MSVLRKIALVTLAWVAGSWAQAVNQIRINQIGWNPEDPKTFVLATPAVSSATTFQILRQGTTTPIFSGTLGASEVWTSSGENARVGDFSAFKETGSFVINIPGVGTSWPFEIQNNIYDHITRAALKMYYFQRASYALEPAWAGQWARAMGHPDTAVKIHNAAETPARPTGFLVRSPGGWYDAGDYNKYILTAGISMWTLMSAYEHNTSYFDTLQIGIPEDNNGLPSIVSELLYELRWLLTMQDPNDGGVYNKLTSAGFGAISIMPAKNTASRYLVPKNTDATLEFAAITAYSARFLKPFESKLPGLADSCLKASKQAWAWARKYPDSQYTQGALISPSVETGIYANANGALTWAGTELWLTTAQDSFYNIVKPTIAFTTPNWADVRSLPLLSIMFSKNAAAQAKLGQANLQAALADLVRRDSVRYTTSAFRVPIASFTWGSNGTNSNMGMLSIMAAKSTGATGLYLTGNHILDYLLGRNGIGVSYLTGYGDSVPKDPHHRPSVGDGVKDPVPGFLVGGPNAGREDARVGQACNIAGIKYPSLLAAKSWIDHNCSYASNEVAINWNAPFVYLAGSLAAQRAKPVTNRTPITGLAPRVAEASVRVIRMAGVYIFRGQESWLATSVRIVDLSGQTVASLQNAGQEVRWAPQNLKSGLYFAQVQGNGQMQTVPLMIP